MRIAYYMPFKPMGHPNPSGDLITGTEIHDFLATRNHTIERVSTLRCRWIYYKPLTFLRLLAEKRRIISTSRSLRPDLWLSYHSYYKAPDILGSSCCRKLKIPYVIFQGIYSTKRRKRLKTWLGFQLNRKILLSADHIITNKTGDFKNLKRLIPENKLSFIAPGIHPDQFIFSKDDRQKLRKVWHLQGETVVMTAAMMRPGVKSRGITTVIQSCAELAGQGIPLRLIIAGDGSCRQQLEKTAAELLPGKTIFLGKIPRHKLYQYYSAADIFAFPGIEESLGMVYLEAQSCKLPVVAYKDWGGGEAVVHEQTGLLSALSDDFMFTENIKRLAENDALRTKLAENCSHHIRRHHDLDYNYSTMEKTLIELAASKEKAITAHHLQR